MLRPCTWRGLVPGRATARHVHSRALSLTFQHMRRVPLLGGGSPLRLSRALISSQFCWCRCRGAKARRAVAARSRVTLHAFAFARRRDTPRNGRQAVRWQLPPCCEPPRVIRRSVVSGSEGVHSLSQRKPDNTASAHAWGTRTRSICSTPHDSTHDSPPRLAARVNNGRLVLTSDRMRSIGVQACPCHMPACRHGLRGLLARRSARLVGTVRPCRTPAGQGAIERHAAVETPRSRRRPLPICALAVLHALARRLGLWYRTAAALAPSHPPPTSLVTPHRVRPTSTTARPYDERRPHYRARCCTTAPPQTCHSPSRP